MRPFYIDCTYTFNTGGMRGVPRVVRNLIKYAELASDAGMQAQPVIVEDGRYVTISQKELDSRFSEADISQSKAYQYGYRVFMALANLIATVIPHPSVRAFVMADIRQPGLASLVSRLVLKPVRYLQTRTAYGQMGRVDRLKVHFRPGDYLFTPDCVWSYDYRRALIAAKSSGAKAILLTHDIMPITHPQWCRSPIFLPWIETHLGYYDAVVANSRYTLESIQNYLRMRGQDTLSSRLRWTYFTLGSNLSLGAGAQGAEPGVTSMLPRHYYLTVSAIEPRKNHVLLLDAFELLWATGLNVTMVWVGKWTWGSEALRQRVQSHPEKGKRLILLEHVSDADLGQLYSHAKALLFPSWVEGFGLPIAEAMARKLPIIASDTPIHREVAGDDALYFSPADLLGFCALIKAIEEGEEKLIQPSSSVLSWQDSVTDLFHKIRDIGV